MSKPTELPILPFESKKKFAGWNAYFLTNDLRMPKLMRLSPSKKTPLFNGPLECRLFEIKMVAGSNRRDKKTDDPADPEAKQKAASKPKADRNRKLTYKDVKPL